MWRPSGARPLMLALACGATALLLWMGISAYFRAEPARETRGEAKPLRKDKREVTDAERAELIARAQIWQPPQVPIGRASLAGRTVDEESCRFKVTDLGGTTPKFDCVLESGEEVRIKYGNGPEIPAEAAATRLLAALGFAADHVTLVGRLRCYGCPKEPFSTMKTVEITRADPVYRRVVDFNDYEDFEWVTLERKFDARPVETDRIEGWSFFELTTVDPKKGGAPRAHVDALRMIAVLLAHWDNKSENQRLVCLSREWPEGAPCGEPLLLLHDVGATFGPLKLDLAAWEKTPIWEDRRSCRVSMRFLPFEGATFGQAQITERGRRFVAELLGQLSDRQLTDLFTAARFGESRGPLSATTPVTEWVRVFKQKVREISEGPPCATA